MSDVRGQLAKLMQSTIMDAENWTYEAVRPLPVLPMWTKGQHVISDCSKGVQMLCRWAGAPDPMDNGFGPYGNSQTIWLVLRHLDTVEELEVGDIVTFGVDGQDHAAMVMEAGSDPLLWSDGHQGAPNAYRLSDDHRPHQFCKLPVITSPPSPGDNLRAMTGFYSWVAWRLGEGPWKLRGKANRTVRPNVPTVIPADWWRRYVQFLARRKKSLSAT